MLCIKTKIKKSGIHGIGLFADQVILKDTTVWRFEPRLDILLTEEEIKNLSAVSQNQFFNYAFLDKQHKKYMLCGDDARFFNHSDNPNCDDSKSDITTALRDIQNGEELTVNYKEFYGDITKHSEILQARNHGAK